MSSGNYLAVRPEWLALGPEEVLEPEVPIVDAHHHFYDRPGWTYLADEFWRTCTRGTTCVRRSTCRPRPGTVRKGLRNCGPWAKRPTWRRPPKHWLRAASALPPGSWGMPTCARARGCGRFSRRTSRRGAAAFAASGTSRPGMPMPRW